MKTEPFSNALSSAGDVAAAIESARARGKKIVTTNGCFDIVHAGHVQYLSEAAALGDILIVGVNCDEVVRRLKGESRPLQNEHDRVRIVSSLRMVDYSFIFREDDPRAFISIIKPDVHVKGGDYTTDIIERPAVEAHGGRVAIVSFVNGRSTTSLVEKIRLNK